MTCDPHPYVAHSNISKTSSKLYGIRRFSYIHVAVKPYWAIEINAIIIFQLFSVVITSGILKKIAGTGYNCRFVCSYCDLVLKCLLIRDSIQSSESFDRDPERSTLIPLLAIIRIWWVIITNKSNSYANLTRIWICIAICHSNHQMLPIFSAIPSKLNKKRRACVHLISFLPIVSVIALFYVVALERVQD